MQFWANKAKFSIFDFLENAVDLTWSGIFNKINENGIFFKNMHFIELLSQP